MPPVTITAEDLYDMGAEARFELIEGELVEYPLHGGWHGITAARLTVSIGAYLRSNPIGVLYSGQVGCVLERNPDTVLAPDLAFIRNEHLDGDDDDGFLPISPDLVVEVLEPNDAPALVERKVEIYLRSGVSQVWLADPSTQIVRVYGIDRAATDHAMNDSLDGGSALPGFMLPVSDLLDFEIARH